MKKLILIGLLLVCLILISGCVICNKPYIRVGTSCCLDKNDNAICDIDEDIETESEEYTETAATMDTLIKSIQSSKCSDECSESSCSEFNYIDCIKKSDGCKDKESTGIVKGKCGVECKTNSDCKSEELCEDYKCILADYDGDGLLNNEELELGTNPKIIDTDGDGLNDYTEVKLKGTNPLSDNTDGDRYNDNEDSEPLKINSASIVVSVERIENNEVDLELITSSVVALGSATFGDIIGIIGAAKLLGEIWENIQSMDVRTLKFTIINEGDDYSDWVEFDLYIEAYWMKNSEVIAKKNIWLKKYNLQERRGSHSTKEKADVFSINELNNYISTQNIVPEECQGILSFCNTPPGLYNVQNVKFESYP